MSAARQRRVVVVGGGLAGLSAAWRLRAAGVPVTVLEAAGRIGGRLARETLDAPAGIHFEPVPQVVPGSAPEVFGLVHELGLSHAVRRVPVERMGVLRRGRVRSASTRPADVLRGHPLRGPRLARLIEVVLWLGGAPDPAAPERETRLDDRSVSDFARVYLGRRVRDRLLVPLLESCFGLDADETSRQLLFSLLDASGAPRLAFAFGLSALPEALAAQLDDVRLGARVASLRGPGGGVRLEGGEDVPADAVILAVPGDEAAKLVSGVTQLSPVAHETLERTRHVPGLHLVLWLGEERALPETLVCVPRDEGGALSCLVQAGPRLLIASARPGFAARHGQRPDAELEHMLLESAARVLPHVAREATQRRLFRSERATPLFRPGRYREIARLDSGIAGDEHARLVFCGDYRVAPHAEGAAASGRRAAQALLSAPAPRP